MTRPTAAKPQNELSRTDSTAATAYGRFSPDGREYVIHNPRTPRPWVNVISNPGFGLVVSQTGSGFTWRGNSQLAAITRWEQDLARDASGRFLYVRDAESGRLWSAAPAPTWPAYDAFEARHGLGYTTFLATVDEIETEWTLFADAQRPIEHWRVRVRNVSKRERRIELTALIEWCCGVAPSPRREFQKLFVETEFDAARGAIFARSNMWEAVQSDRWGHWNHDFPYVSVFACCEPVLAAQGDKAAFLGRYGDYAAPQSLAEDLWKPCFGRHHDPIAALRSAIDLRPGQEHTLGFVLAAGDDRPSAEALLEHALDGGDGTAHAAAIEAALERVKSGWHERLAACRISTPEPTLDCIVNDWVRYQAISARLWGRVGYYQQSGAFGFRDQLQDSQLWLTSEPVRCREQILLHAAHQFADGSVYHWWHPLTETGLRTRMTDDLLWLAYVTGSYILETGDLGILLERAPFVDDERPATLCEHVWRAFQRSFSRTSPRGIPLIGAGDWNDGLSAVGREEKGESFWLAEFLVGLLDVWSQIAARADVIWPKIVAAQTGGDAAAPIPAEARAVAADFSQRRTRLIEAINRHGWDGHWYIRATLDDGRKLGSRENRVGRIFLNAQTWAILNDVAPPDRAAQCLASVREQLVSEAGALLLAPAFDRPIREIGYITRYAPGLRENGGVYTHAATWAIAAACKMRDSELVGRLLRAINPALKDPERYWAEPYVLPGNVDGPDSPYHGRAGWTWYTGSAAWLHRVVTQWVLGVQPTWEGLRIAPCLPPEWAGAAITRPYRGSLFEIRIERDASLEIGKAVEITLGERVLEGDVIPPASRPGVFKVRVRCR